MVKYPTLDELKEAGAHYGHVASKWHPKMKPFIFTTKNSVHVINLEKTIEGLKQALECVKSVVMNGGTVLFAGTKRQGHKILREAAIACGMPYVSKRWLGGIFTNFRTIQKTIKKLEKLHEIKASPNFEAKYTKKERLLLEREIKKMESLFEGIKSMKKLPEAIFVIDVNHDQVAVREANATNVKVIGMVDTNASPENIDYPIPSNDDSVKGISLITTLIAEGVKEGRGMAKNE